MLRFTHQKIVNWQSAYLATYNLMW